MIKKLFAVEYETENECSTFEIFRTLQKAENFSETVKPLYIFTANFNNVYEEKDGTLNYDDLSDTINDMVIIKDFRT